MAADLSLRLSAQEDVSKAAASASEAIGKLQNALGEAGKGGKEAADGMDKAEHGAESLGEEVFKAEAALHLLEKAFEVVKEAAEKAFEYFKEGAQLAMADERAFRALQASIGPTAKGIAELTHEIERKTGADHVHLTQVAATLAALGMTTAEIERALPAMQAWSDVTGRDMTRATRQLTAALESGKLNQQIKQFEQFLGPAAAMAETFGGKVKILAASLEELQEKAGEGVTGSDALKTSLGYVVDIVRDLTEQVEHAGPAIGDALVTALRAAALSAAMVSDGFGLVATALEKIVQVQAFLAAHPVILPWADPSEAKAAQDSAAEWTELAGKLHGIAGGATSAREAIERLDVKLAGVQSNIGKRGDKRGSGISLKDMDLGIPPGGGNAFRDVNKTGKTEEERIEEALRADTSYYEQADKILRNNLAFGTMETDRAEKAKERIRARYARSAEHAADKDTRAAARAAKKAAADELKDDKKAAEAGVEFATNFARAIKDGIKSGDPLQFLKGAAMAVGKILSMLIPGVGGIISGGLFSVIGGALREGGPTLSVPLPKARRGIAFADMDSDGSLFEGHPGEVMWNAQAVGKNGGMDRVAAQNNPLEPPMASGGERGNVVINLSTLTPKSSREAVISTLEPVLGLRLRANQGKYTADLRRRLRRRAR